MNKDATPAAQTIGDKAILGMNSDADKVKADTIKIYFPWESAVGLWRMYVNILYIKLWF